MFVVTSKAVLGLQACPRCLESTIRGATPSQTQRLDAGAPRTSPHANTEAAFLRARRAGAQELGQERVSVQDAQVLARALTEDVWTERMEKEATFQHNKVICAAIETVLEGSASPEETEHLAGLVVEFHKLETKRNRDRACEIRHRSQAFKDMSATPFFLWQSNIHRCCCVTGYDSRGCCTVRH